MQYLLMEHNGDLNHLEIVENIEDFIMEKFGHTKVEEAISTTDKVIIYNRDLDPLVSLNKLPKYEDLNLLFNLVGG